MTRATADSDVFRAIADPSRRVILDALAGGPKSFGDLHDLLPMTKGAVSQHLATLTRVGLVTVNDDDRAQRYSLTPAPLYEVDEWIDGYRAFWSERLDVLGTALASRRRSRTAAQERRP